MLISLGACAGAWSAALYARAERIKTEVLAAYIESRDKTRIEALVRKVDPSWSKHASPWTPPPSQREEEESQR